MPSDGLFHHVVATKSGPNSAVIHVDGVASTVSLSPAQIIANTAFPLTFTGAGAPPHTLDEFAIYGRALTAAEVAEHHAAGVGGIQEGAPAPPWHAAARHVAAHENY